jgi:small basic protein
LLKNIGIERKDRKKINKKAFVEFFSFNNVTAVEAVFIGLKLTCFVQAGFFLAS